MATVEPRAVRPEEAIRFFRDKGYAIGFDWRDVWQHEHAVAFTVAKAMSLDVLADIRTAVDMAIADGITFRQFEQHLAPILRARGWWGRAEMTDPQTGETVTAQLGSRRRLGIIFDTNIRTAYAAGQWERIQRLKDRRPWLRYVAVLDERTRDDHRRWHGTVLPADDPWWTTHFPPNGWRCRCSVQQLSDRDLSRYGFDPSSNAPPDDPRPWFNKRTGQFEMIPDGIDPGFASNPGLTDRLAEAERRLVEKRALVVAPARPAGGADPVRVAQLSREARAYVLDRGRETGLEHLVAIDAESGQVLGKFSGEADAVRLPDDLDAHLADRGRRIVIHHNHPIPRGLSEADLRTLGHRPGLATVAAHTNEGSDHAATFLPSWRGDAGMWTARLVVPLREAEHGTYFALRAAIRSGEIDADEAELLHAHVRSLVLARIGLIRYDYSLSGEMARLVEVRRDALDKVMEGAMTHVRRWIPER